MSFRDMGLSPVIKWTGGKEQELKYILPNMPTNISRFIEPFVGGGAVYFSVSIKDKLINDKSTELINLYKQIKDNNVDFIERLTDIQYAWIDLENILDNNYMFFKTIYYDYKNEEIDINQLETLLEQYVNDNEFVFKNILKKKLKTFYKIFRSELLRNIPAKMLRMKTLENQKGDLQEKDLKDNFECALKGSFYMFIRTLYNYDQYSNSEYFYFIREYCYSSMFRYNNNGKFNVPYGGISYNRKDIQRKIDYLKSTALQEHFNNTEIYNLDFEEFLDKIDLRPSDFVFLDPPYDTDFSSYVNNTFDKTDQERLANYLINKCPAKFMLVIKNTNFILNLYNKHGLYINSFDKKYMVSFKNRNNRNCEHLIITNYELPSIQHKVTSIPCQKQLQYA